MNLLLDSRVCNKMQFDIVAEESSDNRDKDVNAKMN